MDPKQAILYTAAPAGFIRRSDFGSNSDFVFGSATSAFQIEGASSEGGRGKSIWDTFAADEKRKLFEPYSEDAVYHYKHYEDDVKIMKEIGFDAYRFSISWSRILPTGKKESRNEEGIEFYKKLLKKLKDNDIEPFATLMHFDPPQALEEDYRGFLNRKIADDFCDYADICFKEFGKQVKYWITINEPWSFVYGGYVYDNLAPGLGQVTDKFLAPTWPPGAAENDGSMYPPSRLSFQASLKPKLSQGKPMVYKMAPHVEYSEPVQPASSTVPSKEVSVPEDPSKYPYIVAHNQLLAHAKAANLYKKTYQDDQKGKIGITLVSMWAAPLTDDTKDKEAAERVIDFMLGWFLGPLVNGEYPKNMLDHVTQGHLPDMAKDKETIKGTCDFIGLNYYTGRYVSHKQRSGGNYITDQQANFHEKDKHDELIGEEKGACGWLYAYPRGIMDLLLHIKNKYGNPLIYITENGFDDADDGSSTLWKSFCDQKRISYLHDHLSFILKAKQQGVNVKGYFVWSLLDNFEWGEGFKVRFGINYVDYDDGGKRYPKLSARWLKYFLAN